MPGPIAARALAPLYGVSTAAERAGEVAAPLAIEPPRAAPRAIEPAPAPPVERRQWTPAPVAPAPVVARGDRAGLAILADLGMPAELLDVVPPTVADEPYAALAAVLATLPPAPRPPVEPGAVIAVVGDAAAAVAAARGVADTLRLGRADVVVAAPGGSARAEQVVQSPLELARRSPQLRGGEVPAVVAVDAPMGPAGAQWAREMLSVLRPDAVWYVADATRKTADLRRQMQRLGGVDAVILENVSATEDPAAALALGVPVAVLDGRRATRAAWSAVVVARIAGEEDDE